MTTAAPLQASLFGGGAPDVDPGLPGRRRTDLAGGAWVDHVPGWLAGEQTVFDQITERTRWSAHRRPMYDRIVDVPRLTASLPDDGPTPSVLARIQTVLTERYDDSFERIGLAWYLSLIHI